jgi:uncharacterized cupin superfamily protein
VAEVSDHEKRKYGRTVGKNGWFFVHVADATWIRSSKHGIVCDFEGDNPFPQVGINIHVVQPGQPACLYHREDAQENFFILSGECLLLVEEEEHSLKAGHFVHCPPGTNHVFVGAGEEPCAILMVGHRSPDVRLCYPVSGLAAKYGASVEQETTNPREAYGQSPVFDEVVESAWPLY